MEGIDFMYGDRKRFAGFISGLGEGRIALVSHNDIDGVVAAKVANKVLGADSMDFVEYTELDESLVRKLKKEKARKVVFTDLLVKDMKFLKDIERFADVLIIDHHLYKKDLNSDKSVFLNSQGYCGAYMCYDLFSAGQNLEGMDWLVAIACVADWQCKRNGEWMTKVFEKYGDKFEPVGNNVRNSGKFWDLFMILSKANIYFREDLKTFSDKLEERFWDIGDLEKYAKKVDGEIERVIGEFERKKMDIKDGYFYEFESKYDIRSWVASALTTEKLEDKTIVIAHPARKNYVFSARRQDGKINMNEYLAGLVEGFEGSDGGGHAKAAGGHVLLRDREKFKRKLLAAS